MEHCSLRIPILPVTSTAITGHTRLQTHKIKACEVDGRCYASDGQKCSLSSFRRSGQSLKHESLRLDRWCGDGQVCFRQTATRARHRHGGHRSHCPGVGGAGPAGAWLKFNRRLAPTWLTLEGRLRRNELARVVFADITARRRLEGILHPRIRLIWQKQIESWRADGHPQAVEFRSSRERLRRRPGVILMQSSAWLARRRPQRQRLKNSRLG